MSKFSTVQKVNDVTTVNITAAVDSVTHILYSIVSITSLTKHVQYAAKNISQTFIYISRLIHQDGTPICQGHCTISYHKRFIDIRNTYSTITTKLSHSQRIYHIPSYHSVCILAFLASLTPISSLTFHFLAEFWWEHFFWPAVNKKGQITVQTLLR